VRWPSTYGCAYSPHLLGVLGGAHRGPDGDETSVAAAGVRCIRLPYNGFQSQYKNFGQHGRAPLFGAIPRDLVGDSLPSVQSQAQNQPVRARKMVRRQTGPGVRCAVGPAGVHSPRANVVAPTKRPGHEQGRRPRGKPLRQAPGSMRTDHDAISRLPSRRVGLHAGSNEGILARRSQADANWE
jgi:hypothetical protein